MDRTRTLDSATLGYSSPEKISLNKNVWIQGAGRAIGDSKCLGELEIFASSDGRGDEWLAELCQGLSCNQSIHTLNLSMSNSSAHFDIFQLLTPFMERSPKLRCVKVHGYDTSQVMFTLPSALSEWKNDEKKSFHLFKSNLNDYEGAKLFKVLCQVHNLVSLLVDDTYLGQRVLRSASSDLIEISSSQLCDILLLDCHLGNKTSKMLMDAIKSSTELKSFVNLGKKSNLSPCWLRSTLPFCSITNLILGGAFVSDEFAIGLGDALALNNSVQTLDLDGSLSVTSAGWEGFCKCLRAPNSAIVELCISDCNIDSEGAVVIAMALRTNTTLQDLRMYNNQMIGTMTSAQWHEFTQFLRTPLSAVTHFYIGCCDIDDEGAVAIASALAENRKLGFLDLHDHWDITSVGVLANFHLLLDNKTALEELDIRDIRVDPGDITDEEFGILSTALCNTTTIDSTFSSNHTFHSLWMGTVDDPDPDDDQLFTRDNYPPEKYPPYSIYYTLRMNRNPNKVEVAREKILMHHFSSGGTAVNVFASMSEKVLPHAIEWIGRDKQCYSLMFDFARTFPFLFTPPSTQNVIAKKRKR
jgi:hypothetical protein